MRPARAAAENTPAKPGQQPSFSQSATVPLEPEPRLASPTEVPRPRRSQKLQSQSRTSGPDQTMTRAPRQGHPVTPARDARKEGSQMRPARAAAENTPAKPGRQPSLGDRRKAQEQAPAACRGAVRAESAQDMDTVHENKHARP